MDLTVSLEELDVAQALLLALRRATASIADDRSTPSTDPSGARRAAARVVLPVPQPTSRTLSAGPIAAASRNGGSKPAIARSNASAFAAQ